MYTSKRQHDSPPPGTPSLTYRQRFARTIAHQEVDRPPMDLNATDMTGIDGGPRRLAGLLAVDTTTAPDKQDEAVLVALDTDIRDIGGVLEPRGELARQISSTERINNWGIGQTFNGHHYEATGRPLEGASIEDLERYPWPDPERLDRAIIRGLRQKAKYLFEETPYVVCGRHPVFGVMELGCWMCGFDDFLYRMAGDQDFVHRFFQIVWKYQKRIIELYYDAVGPYIHFTTSGDDFGTQKGPFCSPGMFKELVAPYMEERIRHTRQFTDAVFFHHSCGSIYTLLGQLIGMGVKILNPIQPRAKDMEPERLKRDFGGKLTFYGGIDTQILLPQGTPREVAAETKRLIGILGASGGYILSAAHTLQEDVPAENIVAMYQTGRAGRCCADGDERNGLNLSSVNR